MQPRKQATAVTALDFALGSADGFRALSPDMQAVLLAADGDQHRQTPETRQGLSAHRSLPGGSKRERILQTLRKNQKEESLSWFMGRNCLPLCQAQTLSRRKSCKAACSQCVPLSAIGSCLRAVEVVRWN